MFPKRTVTVVTAAVLSASPVLMNAQGITIAERIEAGGGKPITFGVLQEVSPVSIDELAAKAGLVVDARLVRLKSYVSEDGTRILTDYQIVPNRVLASRTTDVSAVPGPRPPLVLTVPGGEISIKGILVTMVNDTLRPIKNQGQFLVFANVTKGGQNRFLLSRESASIFEIIDGQRVEPLLRRLDPNPDVEGIPLERIVTRIQAAAARK